MSDDRRYLVTRSFYTMGHTHLLTGYRHLHEGQYGAVYERWLTNRAGAVLHTRAEAVEVVARLQNDDPDGYDFAIVALDETP